MIDIVKRFFSKASEDSYQKADQKTEHDIHVATCALLVEIASHYCPVKDFIIGINYM